MKKRFLITLLFVSYLCILVGSIVYLTAITSAFYIFIVGIILLVSYRVATLQSGNFRVKRLNAMEAFSTILFVGAGVLMYLNLSVWVLALTIAVIIDLVVSFRYPNA